MLWCGYGAATSETEARCPVAEMRSSGGGAGGADIGDVEGGRLSGEAAAADVGRWIG